MDQFLETYQSLNRANLDLLGSLYTEDIRFIDPVHEVEGLIRLTEYFSSLYQNIDSIHFHFNHQLRQGSEGYVQWQMTFSHPRLKRGQDITVPGASYLNFVDSGKVCLHRDYFDLGVMLYEQLPVLGTIVSTIKRRLTS